MPSDELLLELDLERLEGGGFVATSDAIPGLVAQGRTLAETLEIAQDVARKLIESHLEHGDPLPAALRAALRRSRRRQTQATISVGFSPQAA